MSHAIQQSQLAAWYPRPPGPTGSGRGRTSAHIVMLALLAAFVTGCGGSDANRDAAAITAARVTRPGEVLLDPAARLRELAMLPTPLRNAWCLVGAAPSVEPAPVAMLHDRPYGPDTASEPFALAVMTDAAAGVAGDAGARRRLVDLFDRWAEAGALTQLERPSANTYYALDRTLLPTLVAFALVRDWAELKPLPRLRIQSWLEQLARLRGPERPDPGAR